MKKYYLIVFFTTILFFQEGFGQTDYSSHFIVFDITGSMVGRGNDANGNKNKNIWNSSVDLLKKQLKYFEIGDKVSLFLYGSDSNKIGTYTIKDTGESISQIINEIKSVKKFETCTCTYYALNEVFKTLDKSKGVNRVYLFTDGNQTKGCDPNCSKLNAQTINSKFDEVTKDKDSDYLFIYKLKPNIVIDKVLADNGKVKIIEKPFSEKVLTVFATLYNDTITLKKQYTESSQKFNLSGTGVAKLLKLDDIKIVISGFNLVSRIEGQAKQKASFINNGGGNLILLKNVDQVIKLKTANNIGILDNEIYTGEVSYTFENGKTKKKIISNNQIINIELLNNTSKVIFNNKNDEPKVTIEFVDKI
jgi:hypothetical protein